MTEPYRVAVFARNEETGIVRALNSVFAACPASSQLKVFVLLNGCTDRTPQVVKDFAARNAAVVPVELPVGDKCNAWNTYVYEHADDSPCHFFMDGDVTCSPHALARLQEKLLASPAAMAIAGVPLSGRHQRTYLRHIQQWHRLYGNLYAVKHEQLARVRAAQVRLPIGLWCNDHLISRTMAARTMRPTEICWEQNIYHPDAGYCFDSLQWYRRRDWRIYWRRRVQYAVRELQIPEVNDIPLTGLPATMDAINRRILVRLNADGVSWLDLFTRAGRRRLQRMYPQPDSIYFERFLPQSNHARRKSGPGTPSRGIEIVTA
jgi:glycosyltransferase involved in cell wall biosynthesis